VIFLAISSTFPRLFFKEKLSFVSLFEIAVFTYAFDTIRGWPKIDFKLALRQIPKQVNLHTLCSRQSEVHPTRYLFPWDFIYRMHP
jgi:hypothetical protein